MFNCSIRHVSHTLLWITFCTAAVCHYREQNLERERSAQIYDRRRGALTEIQQLEQTFTTNRKTHSKHHAVSCLLYKKWIAVLNTLNARLITPSEPAVCTVWHIFCARHVITDRQGYHIWPLIIGRLNMSHTWPESFFGHAGMSRTWKVLKFGTQYRVVCYFCR